MSTYFSEKIKQLRKAHDLTQDQIADIFHVSPQSVSRWETGANYPDIQVLPHLAGFFKVSVDELLGTELILGEEKVAEHKKAIRNLLNAGKHCDAICTARRAVKEHPVNYELQGLLLQALCASRPDNSNQDLKNEVTTIGERVINYCADQNICLWVKFMLFRQYIAWDMKEEAKRILATLPSEVWYTQDANAGDVLDGEEWQKNQQLRIIRFSILLCDFIRAYAKKADLDILVRIEWLKAAMQIEKLVGPISESSQNEARISDALQSVVIAELYCGAGDDKNALAYIEQATQYSMHHIEEMDKTDERGNNYYPWPTPRNLCWILWEDHLAKQQFDSIRSDGRFIKCFDSLKANSRELK